MKVFPTHVGVFLSPLTFVSCFSGIPHSCGGVSEEMMEIAKKAMYSPLMWGCFFVFVHLKPLYLVFPTHVGVFLSTYGCNMYIRSIPHSCGGVSLVIYLDGKEIAYSPLMWGCFSCDILRR